MKGKLYKPFGGGNKKALIERAAIASSSRTEEYKFKSRYGGDLSVDAFISQEMSMIADEHASRLREVEGDKWKDRTTSLLAQPLSAEDLYVSTDRGNPSMALQGTRFFHDELSIRTEDDQGNLQPPSIDRYPYSSEANFASKKLANKLAKNLARRHYAAAVLQRNYRVMISLRTFRKEVVEAHTASRKIQWFWKKRLERTRKRRQEKDFAVACCVKIQRQMRRVLAVIHVQYKRDQISRYKALVITRFVRFCGKEIKSKRGRLTRWNVHATRIQALVRGVADREYVKRMKRSMQLILKRYRDWWQRKRGTRGRKIMHYLRRSILAKKIVKCQRILRGFIGKRRLEKERLTLKAYERQRKHSEQAAVAKALMRAAALSSDGFTWVQANGGGNASPQSTPTKSKKLSTTDTSPKNKGGKVADVTGKVAPSMPDLKYSGNEVRGTDVVDFMEILDLMTVQILHDVKRASSSASKDGVTKRCIECIDPNMSLNDMPMRRRISLAVLAAFSSHPGGMIHWTALRQCKPFLNASMRAAVEKEQDEKKEKEATERARELAEERARRKEEKEERKRKRRLEKLAKRKSESPAGVVEGNQADESSALRDNVEEENGHEEQQGGVEEGAEDGLEESGDEQGGEEQAQDSQTDPHSAWVERHHRHLDIQPGDDVWGALETSGPLVSILEASRWLEPSLSLRCRVTVQGHLPDKLLAYAVIVRRWTHWVENTLKRAVWTSRLNLPAPKRECPFCLESLVTPAAERDHYPCPNHQWTGYFVPKSAFLPVLAALEGRLANLTTFPVLKRSKADKDVAAITFKAKARNDEAYRAFKVVGPHDVDEEQQKRLAQVNAQRFIALAQDAVKKRDEEEQAEALIRGDLDMDALAQMTASAATSPTSTRSKSPVNVSDKVAAGKDLPAAATPDGKPTSNPSTPPKNAGDAPVSVRSPPPSPEAPKGSQYILFVQEYYPKTVQLFAQFDHEEILRRAGLDAAAGEQAGSPTGSARSSPFSTPPKKGTTLVFSKSGDFLGELSDDDDNERNGDLYAAVAAKDSPDGRENKKKEKKKRKKKE